MTDYIEILKNKIVSADVAKKRIAGWKLKSDVIVFTNGCFDLLHPGHITYLAKARSLGNRLVVGLNSDDSVKRLNKGENRPILSEDARALDLAALHTVDLVILFNDDTPLELIKLLHPDVLVKGGDYDPQEKNTDNPKYIVGSDVVSAYGGQVDVIPFVEGYSTSKIVEKIKS